MIKYIWSIESPIGLIYLAETDGAISDLSFKAINGGEEKETPLISLATEMLGEYFDGKLKVFDLPISFNIGTEFQKKSWSALLTIPYGQTRSYKEQSLAIGSEKAFRAVGNANGKNPISIIVPCHRVIGTDGTLVGYGGGLDIKRYLLELEAKHK
ncbi:MAG: methylated-DNA--[protein]-cysteine S-methyltransferase [Oscillospiraceae bacterium]|nr:methylated-DNA--[protein]-cysteine S-methyltransferase [Oscillospiraceae bacterium]